MGPVFPFEDHVHRGLGGWDFAVMVALGAVVAGPAAALGRQMCLRSKAGEKMAVHIAFPA